MLLLSPFALFCKEPDTALEAELERDLGTVMAFAFPPLSILEKERQYVQNKRACMKDDLETIRAERDRLQSMIADLDRDDADICLILSGLDKHEAEIAPAQHHVVQTVLPSAKRKRGALALVAAEETN